ncbi:MAG: hypothetical protein AAF518_20705 [Spirochaetota bacterium]
MVNPNIIDREPSIPANFNTIPVYDKNPEVIRDLWNLYNNVNESTAQEAYHNALAWIKDLHVMFSYGVINLKQRSHVEQLFYGICHKVRSILETNFQPRIYQEILKDINERLVDKYFINFSLFASTPDAWALGQLFPIVPLNRLDEYPESRATLNDLTCDSDGKFKKYVHNHETNTSLPVHSPIETEPYLVGIFLVGAYQEIMGDMHNLFGSVHSISINIEKDGNFTFNDKIKGDTVRKVLDYVDFESKLVGERLRKRLQEYATSTDKQNLYMQELEGLLNGYTYLEN